MIREKDSSLICSIFCQTPQYLINKIYIVPLSKFFFQLISKVDYQMAVQAFGEFYIPILVSFDNRFRVKYAEYVGSFCKMAGKIPSVYHKSFIYINGKSNFKLSYSIPSIYTLFLRRKLFVDLGFSENKVLFLKCKNDTSNNLKNNLIIKKTSKHFYLINF